MTRAQVRDVLGSPLLADPFHADRWDYVFTIRRQGAEPQLRRVVVRFKGDALESIEGGADLPSEREFVASIDTFKTARNAPPLVLTDEQIKALPAPAARRRRAEPRAAGAGAHLPAARAALMTMARRRRDAQRRRVAIAGASGRMGRTLIEAIAASADLRARRRARRRRAAPAIGSDATAFLGRDERRRRSAPTCAPALAASRGADRLHPARGNAGPPRASAASSASPR